MCYRLKGNWTKGWAFDLHTVASVDLGPDEFGHDRFDSTRSEMGEMIYQINYKHDQSAVPKIIPKIINLLSVFQGIEKFDAIIPVPSSKARAVQPVDAIAKALGQQRGVRVLEGYLVKVGNAELKGIHDPEDRLKAPESTIKISGKEDISGQRVLLLDDLYRSGATLNACCNVLKQQAMIKDVSVLTMTKTRSNR